jgi:CBS domain-containing protein
MRARELMSSPVVTVSPDTPLKEVAELMLSRRVSGLPVVDGGDHLVGIISESDFLPKLEQAQRADTHPNLLSRLTHMAGPDHALEARSAGDLMTSRVIAAEPEAEVREVVHLMVTHKVNRVPIVERGHLVGIVTRADLLRTLTRDDAAITEEAESRLTHDLWIEPGRVRITTQRGVVTVKGEVDSRSDAMLLQQWFTSIVGVVAIDTSNLRYRLDDRHIKVGGPLG